MGRYSTILFQSLRKYGWDAHVFNIIEEIPEDQLDEREIFWISELNTYHPENGEGMNMTRGGDGHRGTWMHDTERRQTQAKRFSGKGNPFYGKTHSGEYKKKSSKRVSEYNKKIGWKIPDWGVEKGRQIVMRPVVAYNNKGTLIGRFNSLKECAKGLNINRVGVSDSLKYGSWHLGKYMFKYSIGSDPNRIDVGRIKIKTERRPVLFLNEEFDVMAEYESPFEASKELQVPITTIRRAALYNFTIPIKTGHIFIYKDLYEQIKDALLN